jgi:uncharacterized membrane protein (UPF0182 family)
MLHAAAFVVPAAAVAWARHEFRLNGTDFASFGSAAIVAAQIAVFAGWPLLERFRRSAWLAPLLIGFGMALVTHLLFGVFGIFTSGVLLEKPVDTRLLETAMFISFWSAVAAGAVTAPATMALAVAAHRLRRKELVRVAV